MESDSEAEKVEDGRDVLLVAGDECERHLKNRNEEDFNYFLIFRCFSRRVLAWRLSLLVRPTNPYAMPSESFSMLERLDQWTTYLCGWALMVSF